MEYNERIDQYQKNYQIARELIPEIIEMARDEAEDFLGLELTLGQRMILSKFVRASIEDMKKVTRSRDSFYPDIDAVTRFFAVYYPDKHRKYMDEFMSLNFLRDMNT